MNEKFPRALGIVAKRVELSWSREAMGTAGGAKQRRRKKNTLNAKENQSVGASTVAGRQVKGIPACRCVDAGQHALVCDV